MARPAPAGRSGKQGDFMFEFIKKQSPVRVIALGFALVILLGSVLLIMPFSVQEGVDEIGRAHV